MLKNRRWIRVVSIATLLFCLIACLERAGFAQTNRGFSNKVEASATGGERAAQPDLWVLEVHLKPMRLISIEVTDPKTAEKRKELVWYLVYKAINRPIERLGEVNDTLPINQLDPPPTPTPIFVPEFTLVTRDNVGQKIYPDVINKKAQAEIVKRERQSLKNAVEIVGPIPEATPYDSDEERAIYGVAMWRGIDPETDYFTVYMSGFSNGYRIGKDEAGNQLILEKTVMQKYWRPGDQFLEEETEFRKVDEPIWIFRPENGVGVDVSAGAETTEGEAPAQENPPNE